MQGHSRTEPEAHNEPSDETEAQGKFYRPGEAGLRGETGYSGLGQVLNCFRKRHKFSTVKERSTQNQNSQNVHPVLSGGSEPDLLNIKTFLPIRCGEPGSLTLRLLLPIRFSERVRERCRTSFRSVYANQVHKRTRQAAARYVCGAQHAAAQKPANRMEFLKVSREACRPLRPMTNNINPAFCHVPAAQPASVAPRSRTEKRKARPR